MDPGAPTPGRLYQWDIATSAEGRIGDMERFER